MSTLLIMVAPPGDDVYINYMSSSRDSKSLFRTKEEFKAMVNGDVIPPSIEYDNSYLPDDLSISSVQNWLNSLNISDKRKTIIKLMLDWNDKFTYGYGGAGRRYYQTLDLTNYPIDCSGLVSWSYYHSGIDIGIHSTITLADDYSDYVVSRELAIPGDIVVRSGRHAEILLGWNSSGQRICIGIGRGSGPEITVDNGSLAHQSTIIVRPPELAAFDIN